MKKIIRFVVFLAVIVVSFYLMMTVFLIFAGLAVAGGLIWLYLRYFGKSASVTSAKGITIDQVSSSVPASAASPEETKNGDVFEELRQAVVCSEEDLKSNNTDVYALYQLYEIEVRACCELPEPELPTIVDDIIELSQHVEADDQLRAKTFRLLAELHEANNNLVLALEYYQTALSLDVKVGVKRKITKLKKMMDS